MVIRKNLFKIAVVVAVVAIFTVLVQYFHLRSYLGIEGFNHYRNDILSYKSIHPNLFILAYVLSYIIIIAFCIPGTIVFDLLAGFVFGYFWGSVLVIGSYLVGAIVNFIIVRHFFRSSLEHRFGKFKHFIHGSGKYGLMLNLISLRLIAIIPFWVLNIAAALINVKMRTFIISTLIGIAPMSIIYVIIGDGVHDSLASGHELSADILMNPKIWIPMFCMALILMLPNIIKGFKQRNLPHDKDSA